MSKTIKLVIDGRDASLSRVGVAVYLSNLLRELEASIPNGWEIILICPKDTSLQIGSRINVLPIAPGATDGWLSKLIWYTKLPTVLRNLRADIYFGPPLLLPWSRKLPCATVCTVHDTASLKLRSSVGSYSKNLVTRMLVGRFLRAAAAIICISDFSRREFTELFGQWFETKSYVAYHGMPREFETEIGRAKKAKEHLVKYILTVGTVHPKKNIARLISAFEQINDPELYLYIAGAMSKESDSIVSVAIQSTKSEKIKFVGSVNNVELANLYKNAVLFAFPSLHEGFGIPVLEAFMSGIPVVCSGNTSLPEIAGPGGAILFDPFDISDIKHGLAVALYDKQLRQKLIATGTQRARHFSWTRSANRHWEVFEAVNKINKEVGEFAKSQE